MPVSISNDIYISDIDAKRFVRYMLQDLQGYTERADAAFRTLSRDKSLGNPIGQRRMYNRMVKTMGRVFLDGHIETGKRNNYRLRTSQFVVMDGCLYIYDFLFISKPQMFEDQVSSLILVEISNHALCRLIKRAGVRESDDYIPFLRSLGAQALLFAGVSNVAMKHGETWPLPITVNGERLLLLARRDIGASYPTIVTVYEGEWRANPEIDELERQLIEGRPNPNKILVPKLEALIEAFKNASKCGFKNN